MIPKKTLLESILQFFQYKVRKTTLCLLFFYVYIFLKIFADVIDNKRIDQAWKQIQ